ncbi:large ribosomal subunit protein uL22m [Euwallacea similis]|uniref:large ribosomal subunit protein uL22m n=1 Tax=Euwallacea similis TaxID=1736056 RepID=UPI00344B0EE5
MALISTRNFIKLNYKLCPIILQKLQIHNTPVQDAWHSTTNKGPKTFMEFNKKVYPPQQLGEEPRPAFVCHQRVNIKYSPWKMWYIACLVRGMAVDEAIKQLKFIPKKGAKDVREVIEEAKELAVKEHNVEFGSNMWVAESFVGKGKVIKGVRRHARGRHGKVEYFHCHYFVRLEEGKPPKHYYANHPKEPHELLEEWLQDMRKRKITNSL